VGLGVRRRGHLLRDESQRRWPHAQEQSGCCISPRQQDAKKPEDARVEASILWASDLVIVSSFFVCSSCTVHGKKYTYSKTCLESALGSLATYSRSGKHKTSGL